jgi:hypothetical protein
VLAGALLGAGAAAITLILCATPYAPNQHPIAARRINLR